MQNICAYPDVKGFVFGWFTGTSGHHRCLGHLRCFPCCFAHCLWSSKKHAAVPRHPSLATKSAPQPRTQRLPKLEWVLVDAGVDDEDLDARAAG